MLFWPSLAVVVLLIFGVLFLAWLSAIDLKLHLLPDELTIALALTGALFRWAAYPYAGPWFDAVLGAVAGGGALLLVRGVANRIYGFETMGLGDIKLMGALQRTRNDSRAVNVKDDRNEFMLGGVWQLGLSRLHAADRDAGQIKAWEICNYHPVEVAPETPIARVAELMLEHKIHHVVVMQDGSMKGIVSSLDFVKLALDHGN